MKILERVTVPPCVLTFERYSHGKMHFRDWKGRILQTCGESGKRGSDGASDPHFHPVEVRTPKTRRDLGA
jgi:hypothetical protein